MLGERKRPLAQKKKKTFSVARATYKNKCLIFAGVNLTLTLNKLYIMKHLCILTDHDVRLAKEIYQKATENTTAMVFLNDNRNKQFYVFGYSAAWLKQIIEELGMQVVFPISTIDNEMYYRIHKHKMHYIEYNLTDRDIEIRII